MMKKIMDVKLEVFEGPFELLYHLIEKNEINIYDIPIALLTEQYLAYIEHFKLASMDSMSEFLLMASTLLEIKSKMLLPNAKKDDTDEVDPRDELVKQLIEYKKFKNIVPLLQEIGKDTELNYYKNPDTDLLDSLRIEKKPDIYEILDGVTIEILHKAFLEVIGRKELKTDKVRSSFNSVQRDLYTIDGKMSYIQDLLKLNSTVRFSKIFRTNAKKIEKVVTFLALLELIKLKTIIIEQENNFDEIIISAARLER